MRARDLLPIALVIGLLALIALVVSANTVLNFLVFTLVIGLAAQGWNLLAGYGGQVLEAQVSAVSGSEGDFTVALADGRSVHARRVLVTTGLVDELPDVPGVAEQWGHGVVHCPYCHGWEVRDEPIGVLAVGPASVHHALLFRQLTDDLVYFTRGTDLDADTRALFAARGIRVVDTAVAGVESDGAGITGVRLGDGQLVPRRVLAVATTLLARDEGRAGLGLPMEDLPGIGRRIRGGLT